MKTNISYPLLCGVLVALGLGSAPAAEEQSGRDNPLARQKATLVSVTAKVADINYPKREITLKGPLGNEETYMVDKQVKRFEEIKVGDVVALDYYVSLAAELRKPTPEEEAKPFLVLDVAAKAPAGLPPGAAGLRSYKAVMTIEGLDRTTQTMTLKGPKGGLHTVKVEDPSNLTKMRIGDNVILVFTEALAVSVEKMEKKASE